MFLHCFSQAEKLEKNDFYKEAITKYEEALIHLRNDNRPAIAAHSERIKIRVFCLCLNDCYPEFDAALLAIALKYFGDEEQFRLVCQKHFAELGFDHRLAVLNFTLAKFQFSTQAEEKSHWKDRASKHYINLVLPARQLPMTIRLAAELALSEVLYKGIVGEQPPIDFHPD